jgi:DivIVA domain-containing protein
MIELTPLDVRKKKRDFGKAMRGYDPQEVDHFLELVAERLEDLVREALTLRERAEGLDVRVRDKEGRERAVQEALVTAQTLRAEIKEQALREAELIRREAEASARLVQEGLDRLVEERKNDLRVLSRARGRFLTTLRTLLDRELNALEAEEANPPSVDIDLDAIGANAEPTPSTRESFSIDAFFDAAAAADGEGPDREGASEVPGFGEPDEPGAREPGRGSI